MERKNNSPPTDALEVLKRFEKMMELIKKFPVKPTVVDIKPTKWDIPKP